MKKLLKRIRENNILLDVVNGDLKVFAGGSVPDASIIAEIKAKKMELIQFLSSNDQSNFKDNFQLNIPAAPRQDSYPLSSAQRRLWVHSQFESGSIVYNVQGVYVFEGRLNIEGMQYALDALVSRHESLRTVFREAGEGEARQFILPAEESGFRMTYRDVRGEADMDEQLKTMVAKEFTTPFNLTTGPLLRVFVGQAEEEKFVFSYVMHHIISDGWSMGILIKELLLFYNAYTVQEANPLEPLRIHYKDYATWQQVQLSGESLQEHKGYWLQKFGGELPVLEMPADRARPAVKTYNGGVTDYMIDPVISRNFVELVRRQGSTLFMGLTAAVNTLLHRYTAQEDIVVGTSIASREHTDLENQIGFYVNTLGLRTQFKGENNFKELLDNVRQVTMGAYEHQVYPFDELVDALHLDRDLSRSPLFDVMLVLKQNKVSDNDHPKGIAHIIVSPFESNGPTISKFDLTFFFEESRDVVRVSIAYNSDIYSHAAMERMAVHLQQVMASVTSAPSVSINRLDYLSATEKKELAVDLSTSVSAYPVDKTIVDLFEEQAAKTPDQTALVFEGRKLTYKELDEKANRLAHYLRNEYGILPDDLVGIMLDRSESMIVALLGIMKSGGAYVAIDPENPRARKEFIVKDTAIKALITQTDYLFDFGYYNGNIFAIDIQLDGLETASTAPVHVNKPSGLAYVIYTSGSTGQPKGVMITHRSLVDYSFGIRYKTNIADCKSFGLVSTIAADLGNTVIYTSLLIGGELHIFSAADVTNAEKMAKANVDCLKIVPSHWKALQETGSLFAPNKCLVFGGEQLTKDVIDLLRVNNASCEVYNHYGPSETTIGKLTRRIDINDPELTISLGAPFCNSTVYILDAQRNLLPIGVPGEICIGGDGLARGYLNNEALTAEKFVADPLNEGKLVYRTGDTGRWLPDGTIEFIGRKDDQVKIRGYRIELGEIEQALRSHEEVDAAVVIARANAAGEKELVAYIVYAGNFNKADMQAYLSSTLPSYMLPAWYVELKTLPLTANGKVNRKALPAPGSNAAEESYVAPRTATEEKLVALWQDVLGRERVGVKDNFFDLGGHSLRATRLSSLIHKEFDVNLGLKELFESVVIEEQALLIDQAAKTTFRNIQPVEIQDDYVLSSSQRRLWVLSQFEEGNAAYNVPGVYVFEGELDRTAFERSFHSLIERHESLRTVFRENSNKEVRQYIKSVDELGFTVGYRDLRGAADQDNTVEELVKAEFVKIFDLANGPLVRINLLQTADDKWVLTYVMHHIISDGWSKSILINELLSLYNAYSKGEANPLQPLRLQYKDYAAWQHEKLSGAALEEHKAYWLDHFEGELPVLELPSAKIRPALKTYNGANFARTISRNLGDGIKSIGQQQGSSLFMSMMAAVNALFYRYTGQEDIIIGTPVAGREHIDLQNQIGFYANTLALRTQFSGNDSYRDLLENVKQSTIGAYAHQLYPFDTLVTELKMQRDMSRNPLFDIQVIVENAATGSTGGETGLANVSVSGYAGAESASSVFDMVLFFVEREEALQLNIIYNNDVYDRSSVEHLALHLEQMLAAIIAAPDMPIRKLAFLSEGDRHQLLDVFNSTPLQLQKEKTILQLFGEQAKATPDAVAVAYSGRTLSYRELDEQSNMLAHYLVQSYDIRREQLVGVMLERSEKLLVAMLGIMKAGGVYVPVDPAYPAARKEFIIADTGIKTLITQTDYIFDLAYYQGNVFAIDVQLDTLDTPAEPCEAFVSPADLAYVIYTSGSTGQPKGVMIEHAALSASIQSQKTIFNINAGARCMQFTSSSFDVSVFEIFIALASGGSLYMIHEQDKKEPFLLERFITVNEIEVASIPPAYLRLLDVQKIKGLKKLITGGEPASMQTVYEFCETGTYFNAYGPTESSLCASVFPIHHDTVLRTSTVPIGKPIPFIELYVTDEDRSLVPVGVPGEIYIGGAGLARGYHNRPELTEEKFVDNPFRTGEKMYRTGDLGRWLPDGNMEFLGRKDDQVKVNGYRIELGEVEKAVQTHPGVDAAVVIAKPNKNGENQMVAYIISSSEISSSDILSHLAKSLPAYMLPTHFVQLEALPLTSNGKVDRKKLPHPEGIGMATGIEYVAPSTDAERKMVAIWEELLGKEGIGIRESFFELGGDSIKILRMTTEMKKELTLDIPITDIYKNNTIENILLHASVNKTEIDDRNRKLKEKEMAVRAEIEDLKQHILASNSLPNQDNIEDIYPMSDIEKGMVYESLVNERLRIYHDQIVQRKLFADFDIERLRRAVQLMVRKHPILRTSFNLEDYDTEVQIVYREIANNVEYRDLTGVAREAQEEEVRGFMRAELDNPFRFAEAPLWRMNIYNFGNGEIVMVFQTHHAIIDGWSDSSFTTELNNIYLELGEDPLYEPVALKSSYKDFIIQHETEKRIDEVKDFWKKDLAGYSRTDLFTEEDQFEMFSASLPAEEVRKLEKLATSLNTSIKSISLGAYLYMLKVLNYEDEILAGLVTNNRPNCEDADKILGCFLNTIPLRMIMDENETGAGLVTRVHDKFIHLKNYEGLSVLEIAQIHNKQLDFGNPFFDMIFNFLDYHNYQSLKATAQPEAVPELPATSINNYGRTNTFFDFSVNVTGGNYRLGLRLTRKLKSGFSAEKAARLYLRILDFIINTPEQKLNALELPDVEKQKLLVSFNNNKLDFGPDKTIIELFEQQVANDPDATALVFADTALTYGELNNYANLLAAYLHRHYRLQPDELAGILLERNEWMVIAMLAVLKSGAAYVPMDVEYPLERIEYMTADSKCRVLIDADELQQFFSEMDHYSTENPVATAAPHNLAYVIYTSGSTGQPKGVMIEHKNAHAFIHWCRQEFDGSVFDIVFAVTSICFDLSIFELFYPLCTGRKIRLLPNALSIQDYIESHDDILLNTVPSVVGTLLSEKVDWSHVTVLNMAGEPIPKKYIAQLDCSAMEVRNLYGPSEYTTYATTYRIHNDEAVLIGHPVANTQIYIVSESHRLQPQGVPGEIVIAGAGLARGYLHNAKLTDSKFIADPFTPGQKAYKTGDLGRWLPDGNLEFLGRKDDQFKIRGYRIESGEIEWAMQQYPGIESAVVIARANREGEKELVAYLVSASTLNTAELRTWLAQTLPVYMLPSHFVQLAELPLTPNGKVDKKTLPDPLGLGMATGVEYVAPRNEVEEKLGTIWQDILGRERIGVKDNFFELGGHSLKAMKLLAKIHKVFNMKLKLEDMFTRATIEEVAKEISRESWIRKGKEELSGDLVSNQNFIL
jgi:amino acid adenylation domain-containing protein